MLQEEMIEHGAELDLLNSENFVALSQLLPLPKRVLKCAPDLCRCQNEGEANTAFVNRFWRKVAWGAPGDCWEWTGCRINSGYGRIVTPDRGSQLTHRVSWELHFGPIPDGMLVCHHCDNRPCVNPSHLFLGSNSDNIKDCVFKGRHPMSRLTMSDAVDIRTLHAFGASPADLAAAFSVAKSTINRIVAGRTWAEVA